MTHVLVARDILGAAHPQGATSLVNLYAAMPSLHVAWAAWCALAIVFATAAVILAAGSAGVIAAAHRLPAVTGWLAGRHPGTRAARSQRSQPSI